MCNGICARFWMRIALAHTADNTKRLMCCGRGATHFSTRMHREAKRLTRYGVDASNFSVGILVICRWRRASKSLMWQGCAMSNFTFPCSYTRRSLMCRDCNSNFSYNLLNCHGHAHPNVWCSEKCALPHKIFSI